MDTGLANISTSPFLDRAKLAMSSGGSSDAERHQDFQTLLGRVTSTGDQSPEELARKSAEQFVAMTFVQPLLKQMRESDHSAAPFAQTQGQKQFQSLIDADLSQKIVRASNFPLVNRLQSDLLEKVRSKVDAQA